MVLMRKVAFAISVFGIFVLLMLLNVNVMEIPYSELNEEGLRRLVANQKVSFSGIIRDERILGKSRRILTINDIDVFCDCIRGYLGKEVFVLGTVEEFNEKRQINALRISILD